MQPPISSYLETGKPYIIGLSKSESTIMTKCHNGEYIKNFLIEHEKSLMSNHHAFPSKMGSPILRHSTASHDRKPPTGMEEEVDIRDKALPPGSFGSCV